MKSSSLLFLVFFFSTAQVLASSQNIEVIYGEDNRKDIYDSTNASYIELAKSTAAMISGTNLKTLLNGFDYKVDHADQGAVTVPSTSIYTCKRIISRTLDTTNKDDYAFIELDRKVTDRHPLKVRKFGKIAKGAALVVIGHPTGLPTKISDGANVRNLQGKFFQANLDTYGGNSGSAVFNVATEEVEGVLVRGETDYVYNQALGCQVSNLCSNDGCRGEDVTYITNIPGI